MKNTKAIFNKELVILIPFNDFIDISQRKNPSIKTGYQWKKTIGKSGKVLKVSIKRENFTKEIEINQRRALLKRLRNRKSNINYKERESSHEGTPLNVVKTNIKVPIYKQIKCTETKQKWKDPYSLDVFHEKPQKRRRYSVIYDKSIHEELDRIEKRENKLRKKNNNTFNTTIFKEVVERGKKNQNHNVTNNKEKSNRLLDDESNSSFQTESRKTQRSKKKGYDAILNSTIEDIMNKTKNRKSNPTDNSIEKQNGNATCIKNKSSGHSCDDIEDNSDSDEEFKGFVTSDSFGLNTFDTSYQSDDDFFGFDNQNSTSPKPGSTPKIHILSNVLITNRGNVLYNESTSS